MASHRTGWPHGSRAHRYDIRPPTTTTGAGRGHASRCTDRLRSDGLQTREPPPRNAGQQPLDPALLGDGSAGDIGPAARRPKRVGLATYGSAVEESVKAVARRLAELGSDQAAALVDPELCSALDSFRGRLPVRARCDNRREGCKATIAWWGLPVQCPGRDRNGRPSRMCMTCFPNHPCEEAYVAGQGPRQIEGGRVVWASNAPRMPNQWGELNPAMTNSPPFPYDVWSIDSSWDGCIPTPFTPPAVVAIHRNDHLAPGGRCPEWERPWRQADPTGSWLRMTFVCLNCRAKYTRTNTTMLRELVGAYGAEKKSISFGGPSARSTFSA